MPSADKRYIVFAGWEYYPLGGGDDKHSTHATLEEATAAAIEATTEGSKHWAHVYDKHHDVIVYKT